MSNPTCKRVLTAAAALATVLIAAGCASSFVGKDKKISLSVSGDQWKQVHHGYLTIETRPADALVSLRTVNEVTAHASVGMDESHTATGLSTHDWAMIGSSPIVNFKVPIAGNTRTAPQLGASMDCRFRLKQLSLKIEKPGYQPYLLQNVVVDQKDGRKLVIELIPVATAQADATPDAHTFAAEDPAAHDSR